MKKKILNWLFITMAACLTVMPVPASAQENTTAADAGMDSEETGSDDSEERIYQVALLQSLVQGYYDGIITVGELKEHGDTGIGTFEGVNGEMIVLDGVVYQALADGSIAIPSDEETVPFSNVTFFDADESLDLSGIADMAELQAKLNTVAEEKGSNLFYVVRIDGTFSDLKVRSEYKQEKPYRMLDEALASDQTEFDYENAEGTLVGLYCPDYMGGLNTAGWHLHYISGDLTRGGHVLQVSVDKATALFDATGGFEMVLPEVKDFQEMDLAKNVDEALHKAETAVTSETEAASETAATSETEAASETEEGSGSHYIHDPKDNPDAMKDIIVNPDAVYGFSPDPNSTRLGEYADMIDWTDPEQVAEARQQRVEYLASMSELYSLIEDMLGQAKSVEEIARAVSRRRNELRLEVYKDDPEGLETVKKSNLETYGHEEGPDADELYEKYGSWQKVLEKALSTNAGMDACLGFYDDNYYTYDIEAALAGETETEQAA